METNEIEFPGESQAYRNARDELLNAERNLRRQIETVAEMRRSLPPGDCDFNSDYLAEGADGSQWPMVNVFQKVDREICHTYATELFLHPSEPGQNLRHVDMMWPLWHTLDLTPGGRGDWYPSLDYDGGDGS